MKRSHAVVAVIAAATVGSTAYSMMPSETCRRADSGAALDPASAACSSSGSGSGTHSSRALFGSSDSGRSDAATARPSTSPAGTSRGGFGSFFSSLHLSGGT